MSLTLALRLRLLREHAHLAQCELAAKAHLSRNAISGLENGARDTKVSTIIALADALGVPAHTFLLPEREWIDWFLDDCTTQQETPNDANR